MRGSRQPNIWYLLHHFSSTISSPFFEMLYNWALFTSTSQFVIVFGENMWIRNSIWWKYVKIHNLNELTVQGVYATAKYFQNCHFSFFFEVAAVVEREVSYVTQKVFLLHDLLPQPVRLKSPETVVGLQDLAKKLKLFPLSRAVLSYVVSENKNDKYLNDQSPKQNISTIFFL